MAKKRLDLYLLSTLILNLSMFESVSAKSHIVESVLKRLSDVESAIKEQTYAQREV